MELAVQNNCKTVAFPSISTGVYHFPLELASKIAVETILNFQNTDDTVQSVTMVCFDSKTKSEYDKALNALK